jgi:hypothetical protein
MVIHAPTERLKQTSLIVATTEKDIRIRDLLKIDGKSDVKVEKIESGHSSAITSMVVHTPVGNAAEGKYICTPVLLTACRTDKFVTVWTLDPVAVYCKLEAPSGEGHTGGITAMAVYEPADPTKQPLLITGSSDKSAVVWFLHDGNHHLTLKDGHTDHITALATYAPSVTSYRAPGQSVYPMLITASRDKTAVVWDLSTGDKKHVLAKGHTEGITTLAVQSSAVTRVPLLFTGSSDKSIVVWDLTTFSIIHTIQGSHQVSRIFFHVPHGIPLAELQTLAGSKTKPSAAEGGANEDADHDHDMFGLFSLEDDQSHEDSEHEHGHEATSTNVVGMATAAALAVVGANTAGGRPASTRVESKTPPAEKSMFNSFVKSVTKKARGVTSMRLTSPVGGASDTASVTTAAESVDDALASGTGALPSLLTHQASAKMTAGPTATAPGAPSSKAPTRASTATAASAGAGAGTAPAASAPVAMMIVESAARRVVAVWDLNTCTRLRVVDEGIDALCVYNGTDSEVTTTPIAIAAIEDDVGDIWKLLDGKRARI